MIDTILFQRKHQLWLRLLFLSFSASDPVVKNRLYEFSQIEFRHLKWLAEALYEAGIPYGYRRDPSFSIEGTNLSELIATTIEELTNVCSLYDLSSVSQRMAADETFILSCLESYRERPDAQDTLRVFDRTRRWPHGELSAEQTDALTLFLFEESYKEYELILVYFYQQVRSQTAVECRSYQDLIDESHFHIRSFGEMMASLGILALPRELHPRTYKITDMEKFLRNGIVEEENAKEECRRLSASISDEALSSFFEFINNQESYHIEIMKRLLKEKYGRTE